MVNTNDFVISVDRLETKCYNISYKRNERIFSEFLLIFISVLGGSILISTEIKKRGRGRPKKSEIAAKRKPGKVGRPKGDAAIMNDYKARLLASPKSEKILTEILDAALNPDHPNQSAAWKFWADRALPVKMFEQEVASASSSGGVHITITSVGGEVAISGEKQSTDGAIEAEFTEVNGEDDIPRGRSGSDGEGAEQDRDTSSSSTSD